MTGEETRREQQKAIRQLMIAAEAWARGLLAERVLRPLIMETLSLFPPGFFAPESIPIKDKVDHVKTQGQTRKHHCHWPGCDAQVPPAMWGCRAHWYKIPTALRNRIWAAYRPGQEMDMSPDGRYLEAAREVQDWIKENHPTSTQTKMKGIAT